MEANGERADLLVQFNGVYIQDSSKIELPALFEPQWQGNEGGQAALKIQTLYDYQQGHLGMTFAAGRQHDCPLQTVTLPAGSLRLADMGYFKVEVFKQLNADGVYWVSRVPARAGFWTGEQVVHLATWLQQAQGDTLDQIVELTAQRLLGDGADGSVIFAGKIGEALVIDPEGFCGVENYLIQHNLHQT